MWIAARSKTDSAASGATAGFKHTPVVGVVMRRGNLSAVVVGFAAGGAVLAVLFWLVGTDAVLAALADASPPLVGLVGGLIVAWTVAWAVALRSILAALGVEVPVFDAALVTAGTTFANHVMPFGQASSEPVAAWLLTDVSETEFETGLASIASLDALNFVPSLAFAATGVAYYATATALPDGLGVVATGVIAVAVGLPVLAMTAWRYRLRLRRGAASLLAGPIQRLTAWLPVETLPAEEVAARIEEFVAALERVAADRRRVTVALACSATGWACQALALWAALLALGAAVPVYVPLFVVPIGATASVVPTPGGLGGIEAVNTALLVLATDAGEATIAAAVVIHSVGGFLLTTTLGAAAIAVIRSRGPRRGTSLGG